MPSLPQPPLLAKPALNQAIAIVQKYQAQAISTINASLPPIAEFHKGPKLRATFPWVTVAYEGTAFIESAQQERRQLLQVVMAIESGNFDSELAQDQALDYGRVLDYIFNYLSGPPPVFTDWETQLQIKHETVPGGLTTPWNAGTVKEFFVERIEQSLVMREGLEVPVIEVSLHMRFDLEEP